MSGVNENRPKVSVVMASFNEASEIIGQAIESILNQTFRDFEFIIVDDSTSEDTVRKIESYSDDRIHLIKRSGHSWLPEKLNIGMRQAKGDYIARMDADDIALPERLEKQISFLDEHKEVFVLGGQVNLMDEEGTVFSEKLYPLGGIKLYLHSTYKSPFNHPSVVFRKELVDKGFFYNEELIKTSEDIDLWLRVIHEKYKIANLPDKITNYRIRNNMAKWRSSEAEIRYMAKVRRNTFSWKMPIHSMLSLMAGIVFLLLPRNVITGMYKDMYQKGMKT
jgi:glycosyltransferase involved in cell wall biosynthesis